MPSSLAHPAPLRLYRVHEEPLDRRGWGCPGPAPPHPRDGPWPPPRPCARHPSAQHVSPAQPSPFRPSRRPGSEKVARGTQGTAAPERWAGAPGRGPSRPRLSPASVESSVSLCLLVPHPVPSRGPPSLTLPPSSHPLLGPRGVER